jgi:hypothetical protein
MPLLLSLLGWIAPKALDGLLGTVLGHLQKKSDAELDGFKHAATVDRTMFADHLQAQIETNRLKLAQQSWWGAKLIILTAGLPCAFHLAAVVLDSTPFWIPLLMSAPHPVGAWRIEKLPPPYDGYQWAIVQSFFLVMPAMPLVNAVSLWLARRR